MAPVPGQLSMAICPEPFLNASLDHKSVSLTLRPAFSFRTRPEIAWSSEITPTSAVTYCHIHPRSSKPVLITPSSTPSVPSGFLPEVIYAWLSTSSATCLNPAFSRLVTGDLIPRLLERWRSRLAPGC
ncbi:hypothetical protein OPQ81_004598 [Rhizoctonia solani]|nr:hypothetical protein OPQ81_004598 [Rhizoctonia solani]